MSLRSKIEFAELTDTGKVRDHNEDAIGTNPDIGLMVLADGMGGYNAGEVASGIAVQIVTDLASEAAAREELNNIDSHSGLMRQSIILRDAVYRSNKIIYQTAQSQTHCEGMGTTIVCTIVADGTASIGHVGDSRIYLYRDTELRQLTRDHSWIDEQLKQGILTPEEARKHPLRNVITRALGSKDEVVVDVEDVELKPDDVLLLCSDGLTGMLEDDEIKEFVESGKDDLHQTCKDLIAAANANGGDDNITVILIRYVQ